METFVESRSDKFPAYVGEEEINPGLWGRRLAEYLVEHLPQHGVEPEGIIAEDWGYYIPIKHDGIRLAICCGHQSGDDDEFLCFTDPKEPAVRKFLTKIDLSEHLGPIVTAIASILAATLRFGISRGTRAKSLKILAAKDLLLAGSSRETVAL